MPGRDNRCRQGRNRVAPPSATCAAERLRKSPGRSSFTPPNNFSSTSSLLHQHADSTVYITPPELPCMSCRSCFGDPTCNPHAVAPCSSSAEADQRHSLLGQRAEMRTDDGNRTALTTDGYAATCERPMRSSQSLVHLMLRRSCNLHRATKLLRK